MTMGPNVRKLIAQRVATTVVPSGQGKGLGDVMAFLCNKDVVVLRTREATTWVQQAILAVRQAREPNEWRHKDDETIAGEILRQIDAQRKGQRKV